MSYNVSGARRSTYGKVMRKHSTERCGMCFLYSKNRGANGAEGVVSDEAMHRVLYEVANYK
jgi:hypothetical protein